VAFRSRFGIRLAEGRASPPTSGRNTALARSIKAQARKEIQHENPLLIELQQDVRDLRSALQIDPRFDLAAKDSQHLTNHNK
jgi:hypothetical protein